jgi:excisionase family DNA binding protein
VERWQRRLKPVSANSPEAPAAARRAEKVPVERPRTVSEAAEELGLSVHTVRAWIASRRLAHLRLGRSIRVPAEELRRVIQDSTIPAERK